VSRRTYRYDAELDAVVEVGADWEGAKRVGGHASEAEVFNNLRATDGTDISSRTKRREYMRATGTTDASDYSQSWKKQQAQRAETFNPRHSYNGSNEQRKQALARAFDAARRGR
jgi:hypothetical protein